MGKTAIEWTEHSINPIRAKTSEGDGHYCEKISAGCANCYASKLQSRFKMPAFGSANRRDTVEHYLHEKALLSVLKRKKPTTYFWCDMCDLFGDWVPFEWIDRCFAVMALTPQHTHQVLTKRAERMREYFANEPNPDIWEARDSVIRQTGKWLPGMSGGKFESEGHPGNPAFREEYYSEINPAPDFPLPNVWLGVSAENQEQFDKRAHCLCQTPAAVRFISAEPLLSGIKMHHEFDGDKVRNFFGEGGINWVIVGGESGHNARPCQLDWIRSIVQQCKDAEVACFVKQIGRNPVWRRQDMDARLYEIFSDKKGGDINEFPADLRVRQMPEVIA